MKQRNRRDIGTSRAVPKKYLWRAGRKYFLKNINKQKKG